MTTFPGSPRLLKGALIGLDVTNPLASVIAFQYNPDTMTRRLEARTASSGDGSDKAEALRLKGPPKETITLTIELDATDQLGENNPLAVATGIYPTLSALEMLIYPKSSTIVANALAAQAGILEIIPTEAAPVLFVWGAQRILPVRIVGFTVTEEAYDTLLNPIQAKVALDLLVLSYYDLKVSNPGYSFFLAHQIAKEIMAKTNVAASLQNIGTSLI
jgi:hypothetical protein